VNRGAASWADIAAELARLLDRPLRLKPLTLETAGLRARRPRFSVLSVEKLASVGVGMPDWQDALARYVHANA
jgi:dTDP-4-dehydrorhamnose reductase